MTVKDFHTIMTTWAPADIAWERDNVGLQVGSMDARVRSILVCLDCTEQVIAQAIKQDIDLIISHHPLLFRAPKSITPQDETGAAIRALLSNNINLYSAHTNLDFTRGGTSFAIAEALELDEVDFLHKNYTVSKKIVCFVPESHVDAVRSAMANAGAGVIGNYDQCSFGMQGKGTFKGNESSTPRIGKRNSLEQISEVRLEMIVARRDVTTVVHALKSSHPYEEVAYDVYPLDNVSNDYGMGIIGTLKKPMQVERFLNFLKRRLGAAAVRHTAGGNKPLRRIAACGGAGAELMETAIARQADAFITADIRYHDFHHAMDKILLVDAGHYETEHLVIQAIVKKLKQEIVRSGNKVTVRATQVSTNPIYYS